MMKKHLVSLVAALGIFAALLMPVSAEIVPSVRPISMSDNGKTVTIAITFTCEFTGEYSLSGELKQASGRLQNDGTGYVYGNCTAGEQVTVLLDILSGQALAFKAGPAQRYVYVYVFGPNPNYPNNYLSDDGSLRTVVRLKR